MEDKSRSIFGGDFIVFKKDTPKSIIKSKKSDNDKQNKAVIKIKQSAKKEYQVCDIKKQKRHGSYKKDNSIKYATTDYTITAGTQVFYLASSNRGFDVYKQGKDSKYMESLANGVILNYMFPIYAVKSKNELFVVLNSPAPNDITREIKPDKYGVIKASGGCNIIKIQLDSKKHEVVYQLPAKSTSYSLTAVADKKGNPNILLLTPKNTSKEAAMPRSIKGLFSKHMSGELENIDKNSVNRSILYDINLSDNNVYNLFYTDRREDFDFVKFDVGDESNTLVVIRESE